jgi:integrase
VSILSTLSIPDYRRNETTGRGYASFGDRSVEFGDYSDPQSVAAYDRTLSAWLANGRCLPDPDQLAAVATGPISFEAFEKDLLELYHPKLKAKATRRGMLHALNVLRELGVKSTAEFNTSLIARIITTRDPNLSPNTVRGLLRYIQTICSHAVKCGYCRSSPFHGRPLRSWVRPSKPKGIKYMTKKQVRAILDLLEHDVATTQGFWQWKARRDEALINLISYTGLRKMEALYLKCEDLDFERDIILIVDRAEHRCKTEGSAQPVPIVKPLRVKLLDWLDHRTDAPPTLLRPMIPWVFPNILAATRPWTGGVRGSRPLCRFKDLAERAGIPREVATLHALRRSLATMLESHAAPSMIQRILRHSSSSVTEQYYRKADIDSMHACMKDFSY